MKNIRSKQNLLCMVFFTIFTILFIFIIGITEASRRTLNLNHTMQSSMMTHRTVQIAGRIFDLFINHDARMIIVKGEVETWEEKDRIEEHFKMRAPSNYLVKYEINIVYWLYGTFTLNSEKN